MSLLSQFQIVAWSRLGFLARHEFSSRCVFELDKWMKNLHTVVKVGKNHKIRDHQVDQSMAKFKSSQTQKTFWSKKNSNISILNKLISKFILNRSNWSRFWSTFKTFERYFEVFLFNFNRGFFNSKIPSNGPWPSLKMIFAPVHRPIRCVICSINICQNRTSQISFLIGSRWRSETNWVLIRWIGQLP